MKVRKFFAPSSREALRLVREALGADAVVLSNRVVDGGVELVALTDESLSDMVESPPVAAALPTPAATTFPVSPSDTTRDRTVAMPGILAAGRMGQPDATSLAAQFAPAPAVVKPYNTLSMYDALPDDDDDGADAAAIALSPQAMPAPVNAPVNAAVNASVQTPTPALSPASNAVTPLAPLVARAEPVAAPVTVAAVAPLPVPAAAAAPARPTPAPGRSVFSRMFSRPSFRERVAEAEAESAIPGLRRQEKQDDEASVLGLMRAERAPAPVDETAPPAMTASMASARGLGQPGASIIVRPAVSDEEALFQRQPASFAPLPEFPDASAVPPELLADTAEAAVVPEVIVPESIVPEAAAPVAETLAPAVNVAPVAPAIEIASQTPALVSAELQQHVDAAPVTAHGDTAMENATPSFASASYTAQTRFKHAAASTASRMPAIPFIAPSIAPVASVAPAAPASVAASETAPVTADTAPAPVAPLFDMLADDDCVPAPVAAEADSPETSVSEDVPAIDLSSYTVMPAVASPASVVSAARIDDTRDVADQVLAEMRTLCGTLGAQLEAIGHTERERRDPVRIAMTRTMLRCGFSIQLIRLLLAKMPVVNDADEGMSWVKATFERNLPVLDNEDQLMEQGGVFALMGPTGVGKTTTTAKLAARAVMRHGADRVALLTTDSYRIGAHEQLRIYGRILGVAVHAVKDAADLTLVLSELRNKHMVLIDTIGMSQRDRAVSEQVSMLCRTHLPVKRLLLLNATSHGDTLNEVVRAYGAHGEKEGEPLSGCIITKMDESNGIGAALDTVMRHRLPVHYVSNGQKVPEDLRVARRGFLIESAFTQSAQASPFHPEEDDLDMMFAAPAKSAHADGASSSQAKQGAQVAQAGEVQFG